MSDDEQRNPQSTEPAPGEIEDLDVSEDASAEVSGGGAAISDIQVVKVTDKSSAPLFQH